MAVADDDPAALDEGLRLIGRFVVNFSRYISHLEIGLWHCAGPGDTHAARTIQALTGRVEERVLRDAFFAATVLVREPTDEERLIRTALNKRGQDLAARRNDFAHGMWFTSSSASESDSATLMRLGGKLNEEPVYRTVVQSLEEIRALAQEAEEVALLVWEYISGLFFPGTPEVCERLGFEDRVLVRLLR